MTQEEIELAKDSITLPVRFDDGSGKIIDASGRHILDIRGWGYLQYLSTPMERQDAVGRYIEACINKGL